MDDKVLVRLGHGYYNGGITPLPYFCPTIDAHIDCWHILIGEKMKNTAILAVGEPLALDEQNGYIRQDGTVGTLTTDGSSPKHNNRVVENYRIRKLTPKECGRLMGVRDDDIDKMSVNQSNSSLFHCFGDSIVVDVLMAIFKQML